MDEQDQSIKNLLKQFQEGNISEQGMQELIAWYDTFENDPGYTDGLTEELRHKNKEEQFNLLRAKIDSQRKVSIWPKLMIAASTVIVLSLGLYFIIYRKSPAAETAFAQMEQFKPGGNKAVLTLSGGQKIVLDDAGNGKLAAQGNTTISKTADGKVVYGRESSSGAVMNTMTTPRGGQYHLVLADGTGVWLNAASSITYPSAFTGNTREVEITGEIYFEVAHNAARPFRVKSEGQTVEVLGTHFNINAYANESAVATTLLEGSVRVVSGNTSKIIKPGQQAQLKGSNISLREVDADEVVSWKVGYFDFTDADIQTVMRQISRWYDVDVVFDGPATTETFTGKIPRSFDLAKTIKVMQLSRSVKLTVEGRRIMVR